MNLSDAVRLSGANLRKNPLRTLLTILGLGVGIGAILTVVTLGQAGERQVEAEIARLGVDKVWIKAADGGTALPRTAGGTIAAVAGMDACADAVSAALVTWRDSQAACAVCGYDRGFEAVYGPALRAGRMFTAREHQAGAAVALVDETLAEMIGEDAVGTFIDIGVRRVRVVGVIAPLTSHLTAQGTGTVILPLQTFLDTCPSDVRQVTVSIPKGLDADEAGERAIAALAPGGGAYEASSLRAEIEAVEQVVRIFVMVLACVAAVCMLTGAIGVMNILLVSVRERRREIGLMKAVGGTALQVGVLFLLEAVSYALLGGLLGLLLGIGMIRLFGAWIGLDAMLSWQVALPAMALAGLLGVVFGVAPALRAAGMEPVDALRQES